MTAVFDTKAIAALNSATSPTMRIPNTAAGEVTYKAVVARWSAALAAGQVDSATVYVVEESINRARSTLDELDKLVTALQNAVVKLQASKKYLETLTTNLWSATVASLFRP